jgi:hypothetical protein
VPLIILYESSYSNNETRTIKPKKITKKKSIKSIDFYEIVWNKMAADQNDQDLSKLTEYTTFEEAIFFKQNFLDLVQDFEKNFKSNKKRPLLDQQIQKSKKSNFETSNQVVSSINYDLIFEDSDDDRADVLINPSLDTDLSSSKSEETSPDLTIIEQVKMIEDDGTMFILID